MGGAAEKVGTREAKERELIYMNASRARLTSGCRNLEGCRHGRKGNVTDDDHVAGAWKEFGQIQRSSPFIRLLHETE